MRNFRRLFYVLVLLSLSVSCRKDVNVSINPTSHEFEAQGGTLEVSVESNGAWQVSGNPDWLVVNPVSGEGNSTISIVATRNIGDAVRSAELKVKTKTDEAVLSLTQAFSQQSFVVFDMDTIVCDCFGGDFEIHVQSNCEWTVSSPDWIVANPESGCNSASVMLTVAPNNNGDVGQREGAVVFAYDNQLASVVVKQKAPSDYFVNIDPSLLDVGCQGGNETVAVNCNCGWFVKIDDPWIAFDKEQGDGDDVVVVTIEENPNYVERNASVIFVSLSGVETTLSVHQQATPDPHYLDVNPESVSFEAVGGLAEISVGCDAEWNLSCPASWITLSDVQGFGDGVFSIQAEENVVMEDRNTVVTVISRNLIKVISIAQVAGSEPAYAVLEPDTLWFGNEGGIQLASVNSNVRWYLDTSDSWIHLSLREGKFDQTFEVEVLPNQIMSPRTCQIIVYYQDQPSDTLVIIQDAFVYVLDVNITEFDIPKEGGDFVIDVHANQGWRLEKGANWIHCDPINGEGDGSILMKIDSNLTPASRSAELHVVGLGEGEVIIVINQSN